MCAYLNISMSTWFFIGEESFPYRLDLGPNSITLGSGIEIVDSFYWY